MPLAEISYFNTEKDEKGTKNPGQMYYACTIMIIGMREELFPVSQVLYSVYGMYPLSQLSQDSSSSSASTHMTHRGQPHVSSTCACTTTIFM